MTGASAHGQETIARWLASRHRSLRDGLERFLDPGAGLREIMLHAEHVGVVGGLGSTLDTEAGLAAIVRSSPQADPQPPPDPPQRKSRQPGVAAVIAAADPEARLVLRHHPVILVVILSDLLRRAFTIADGRDRHFDLDVHSAHHFAYHCLPESRAVVDLARDLAYARDMAHDRNRNLFCEPKLAHALALALARVLVLVRAHEPDLARALALGLVSDPDTVTGRFLARDVDPARGDFARQTAAAYGIAGDLVGNRVLARTLANRVEQIVGSALGVRQAKGLAAAFLDGALDDFTRADLARTDLANLDLTGVRWSVSGTGWPPGTDVGELRARSREVASGAGIYVIESPGDGKARHHAPT